MLALGESSWKQGQVSRWFGCILKSGSRWHQSASPGCRHGHWDSSSGLGFEGLFLRLGVSKVLMSALAPGLPSSRGPHCPIRSWRVASHTSENQEMLPPFCSRPWGLSRNRLRTWTPRETTAALEASLPSSGDREQEHRTGSVDLQRPSPIPHPVGQQCGDRSCSESLPQPLSPPLLTAQATADLPTPLGPVSMLLPPWPVESGWRFPVWEFCSWVTVTTKGDSAASGTARTLLGGGSLTLLGLGRALFWLG